MTKTLYADKLDFQSLGYSAAPAPPDDPELSQDQDVALWLRLQSILGQAKAGSFDGMPAVLDLYEAAVGAMFRFVCSRILGDAGTRECFDRMIRQLERANGEDPNLSIHHCSALRAAGFLYGVRIIAKEYGVLRKSQETGILPLYLSSMLESHWSRLADGVRPQRLPRYLRVISARCERLERKFGSDKVLVFGGDRAGVIPYAQCVLKTLGDSSYEKVAQSFLRRRFEASTGIDCSAFYKEGEFQPLQAASIIEEFLESPRAQNYENGVRYFFGHRIPD